MEVRRYYRIKNKWNFVSKAKGSYIFAFRRFTIVACLAFSASCRHVRYRHKGLTSMCGSKWCCKWGGHVYDGTKIVSCRESSFLRQLFALFLPRFVESLYTLIMVQRHYVIEKKEITSMDSRVVKGNSK